MNFGKLEKSIKKLCTPAYLYLVISVISLIILAVQNLGSDPTYAIGNYSCPMESKLSVFIGHIIYIALWTIILNWICKKGFTSVSWVLVLLPFLLSFVLIGVMIVNNL